MNYLLSIIIVNWNGKNDLSACLDSIRIQAFKGLEIIVVDNASTDGSQHLIKSFYPEVFLIELKENIGFPKANNIGINRSSGKYILLLNPDTIIGADNIITIYNLMEENQLIGATSSKILYPNGLIQYEAGRRFYSFRQYIFKSFFLNVIFPNSFLNYQLIGNWDHLTSRYVDCISGAYMFIRREVINDIGILDDRIFMDFEDVDYCYRLKKAGWSIWYESSVHIIHLTGTSRKKSKINFRKNTFDVPYHFFLKHFGPDKAIKFKIIFILYSIVRLTICLIHSVVCFPFKNNKKISLDYRCYISSLKYALSTMK